MNQAYISQIEKQDAVLKTGAVIPMGRDRKKRRKGDDDGVWEKARQPLM